MELDNIIKEMDEIYKKLTSKDNDPEVESQLKSDLLTKISSLIAVSKVKNTQISQDLQNNLESVKTLLLSWDPLDNWFKEVKVLVEGVFDLITAARTLNFEEFLARPKYVTSEEFHKIASTIISDVTNMKKEVQAIKQLSLALQKKITQKPAPKPVPVEIPKPVPVEIPKPVPVEIPKPVPVEIPKPVPVEIPKPVPVEIPKPVPIEIPKPVPVEIPEPAQKPILVPKPISSSKPVKTQEKKEKLFGLFSQPTPEQKPIPINLDGPVSVEISEPTIGPSKTPSKPPSPFNSSGTSPSISIQPSSAEVKDQDKLYQELITLEGKKYSLERKLRDLKAIFDSGAMTESQYKSSSNEKLAELKGISAEIDKIRDQLD